MRLSKIKFTSYAATCIEVLKCKGPERENWLGLSIENEAIKAFLHLYGIRQDKL